MDKRDYYSRILEDIRGLKACGLSGDEEQTILSFEKEIVFLSYTARTEEPMEEKSDGSRPDKRAMSDMASFKRDSKPVEEDEPVDIVEEDMKPVDFMKPMKPMHDRVYNRDDRDKDMDSDKDIKNVGISPSDDTAGKENEAVLDNNTDVLTKKDSLDIRVSPVTSNPVMPAVSFFTDSVDSDASVDNTDDTDTLDMPTEAPNSPLAEPVYKEMEDSADEDIESGEQSEFEETEDTEYDTDNDVETVISGAPDIQLMDTVDLFKEEYEKPLTDFVFDRSIIALTSPANDNRGKIDKRMVVTVFPLHPVADDANTKILCIIEYDKEFYTSSSYENNDGSSIVQMKVDGFELMIMGKWNNYKFQSRIMASGLTAADGIAATVLDDIANNPNKTAIKNGHIKFSYDAAKEIKGTVEVFPVSDIENKTHLFYMRRAAEFNDYNEIGQSAVIISTLDGDKVLDVSVHNRELIAKMVPMSF